VANLFDGTQDGLTIARRGHDACASKMFEWAMKRTAMLRIGGKIR
jgi:hypothetical protein